MSRSQTLLLLLALPLVLSGCKTVSKTFEEKKNIGPCPAALVLWDAARKVEIHGAEKYNNVGFTAEILGTRSFCKYFDDRPITADLKIDMAFGRGPAAVGDTKEYKYFIAVVRKDMAVIDKQFFSVKVHFKPGQSIVRRSEKFSKIVIPRAKENTSGSNFEIIVGLELTPQELAFARSGKRFRIH
ncbi:MAG: hypothetical protein Q9M33_04495 [Robiginitomaculum sp.]|nr:hypothetical protein [Robiginitomaculum sp.]MDQ7078967.1 hypothetical protein [Robiginitomaculum sp.]